MAIARKPTPDASRTAAQPPAPARAPAPAGKVAERAYQIWQARGRPSGHDLEHWLQAERELGAGARTDRN